VWIVFGCFRFDFAVFALEESIPDAWVRNGEKSRLLICEAFQMRESEAVK